MKLGKFLLYSKQGRCAAGAYTKMYEAMEMAERFYLSGNCNEKMFFPLKFSKSSSQLISPVGDYCYPCSCVYSCISGDYSWLLGTLHSPSVRSVLMIWQHTNTTL